MSRPAEALEAVVFAAGVDFAVGLGSDFGATGLTGVFACVGAAVGAGEEEGVSAVVTEGVETEGSAVIAVAAANAVTALAAGATSIMAGGRLAATATSGSDVVSGAAALGVGSGIGMAGSGVETCKLATEGMTSAGGPEGTGERGWVDA